MIIKIPNSPLIAAWIGLLTTQVAGAHEPPTLASAPSTKAATAEVLAPLTAQVVAELDVARLAKELTAAAVPARLAALPVPTRRATPAE